MKETPTRSDGTHASRRPGGRKFSWITWALIVFAGVVVVIGVIVPNIVRVTYRPAGNACINNLRLIHEAKQLWAKETDAGGDAVPKLSEIAPYFGGHAPRATALRCPDRGHLFESGSVRV